jgi:signal transduction histidine kinase
MTTTLLRWFAWGRVVAAPFLALYVLSKRDELDAWNEAFAWLLTAGLLLAGAVLLLASRLRSFDRGIALVGLCADALGLASIVLVLSSDIEQPMRTALFVLILEAALVFGTGAGILATAWMLLVDTVSEAYRTYELGLSAQPETLVLRGAIGVAIALVVGGLVSRLTEQAEALRKRAAEAEQLRDELGRRLDLVEAANRCARALGSSLVLEEAFEAFTHALRGAIPFDRVLVMRRDDGEPHVVASAGVGAEKWGPGATYPPLEGALSRVFEGQTVVRRDMAAESYAEEASLVELGLRSRVVAPLQLGGRTIGFFSISRREPDAFSATEVELVTLLGRLIGSAVQNIRAYEAERANAEELRRLSALRADFVSLVSHELRSPMAAVIGSARTLQARWRDLRPNQRDAFLAVIADETSRLATLLEDVLHTSRIKAGTFTYRFGEVDLGRLVREAVAAAQLAQDEVPLRAEVGPSVPAIRGDAERLRQLLDNLISNAVKHSEAGVPVEVSAQRRDGSVVLAVADRGPGIAPEHQELVFEKFGRVHGGGAKPGTGLGLFIARSIAEAHGGRLELRSAPGEGSTFSVVLPCS